MSDDTQTKTKGLEEIAMKMTNEEQLAWQRKVIREELVEEMLEKEIGLHRVA
ncbi:hypothetical protein [Brevibacillus reuszeri]|uniref:hypothetical protein n=1 Tax=Brevibacillus reuszeri TaxID=54915 RepID=UPI0013E00595|nr:hypothetical protein [Brevibacillus reuszeri]